LQCVGVGGTFKQSDSPSSSLAPNTPRTSPTQRRQPTPQVLFTQQLVLFAPHAVPPRKYTPLLLTTLTSKRPALRRAAAATLCHLAERDPAAVLQQEVESHLLAALDAESDAQIADQLRSVLAILLAAGAPAAPGYWLRLLAGVALAAPAARAGVGGPGAAVNGGGGDGGILAGDDNDDEDDEPPPARSTPVPPAAAAAAAAPSAGPAVAVLGGSLPPPPSMSTPRLRTRLFAADLLLALFAAVGPDPRHRMPPPKDADDASTPTPARPPSAAAAAAALSPLPTSGSAGSPGAASDYLVDHLQALIDAGFKLTTGGAEALRPTGARLLQRTVRWFAGVWDPDVPEALLLEQYQAQVRIVVVCRVLCVCGGGVQGSFRGASGRCVG